MNPRIFTKLIPRCHSAGPRVAEMAAGSRAEEVAAGSQAEEVTAGPGAVWRDWYGKPCLCRTKPICELNPYGRQPFPVRSPGWRLRWSSGRGSIDQRVWTRAEGDYKSFDFLAAFFCILHGG